MNVKIMIAIFKKLVPLFMLLVLAGCCTNRANITVSVCNSLWNKTVYADVACIKEDLLDQYEMCSKQEYWGIDSELRNKLHSKSLTFNAYFPTTQIISEDAQFWEHCKNDDYLIVLADLPDSESTWKMIVPLEYYSWFNFWDKRDIKVYISQQGIEITSTQ